MTGRVFLALDLATRFGWALGAPGSTPTFGGERWAPQGAKSPAIFGGVIKWANRTIRDHGVTDLVFEAPVAPNRLGGKTTRDTALRLMGIPACVEGVASLCGIDRIHEVSAPTVRKTITGKGIWKKGEAKAAVMAALQARGFDVTDDDAADALAIWLHATAKL